jgi:threonine/homoserine/homoserine lactone efflux protein
MSSELIAFVRGVGIGAAVAAPVGPMSLLCMRRTLAQGWGYGFGTGVGIAVGDGFYAFVAALGLAGVMQFMVAHERPLHIAAGSLLVYLGWHTFFLRTADRNDASTSASALAAFASALLLTLTNPPTIVSFVAIFTAFVPAGFDAGTAMVLASGVFMGSLLWWLALTAVVLAARHVLGRRARCWIDRLSGAVLGLLGAAELRRAA